MYIEPIRKKKVFAYFACGPISRIPIVEYDPFDIVILVDRNLNLDWINDNNRAFYQSERFILLETDAAIAVDIIHRMGIKIDVFMCLNEGLFEGGGDYAINDRKFLRFLTPILEDNYIHINNDRYFKMFRPRIPNLQWDFVNYDEDVIHRRKLRHIISKFVEAGHDQGVGATKKLFRKQGMVPPIHPTRYPGIIMVNSNIWSADDIDIYLIPERYGFYKYVLMRRIGKKQSYNEHPGTYEGNYAVRPNRRRSQHFRIPVWERLRSLYSHRYSIDLNNISVATIDVIKSLHEGCRVGIDAYGREISDENLRLISDAAMISGCEILIYK